VRDARWQELSSNECRKLLAGRRLGRVAVVDVDGPAVFPVSYAVDRDAVLFRASQWPKLPAQVVLQVDDLDETGASGWSVTVSGEAMAVQEPKELDELRRLRLRGDGGYVRLHHPSIRGHRLARQADLPSNWLG
jgi:nitroimidazol reductase NimA-like FMN-containing flavoprotein (pyridoxamine 5'-phosphate oxidase superfamily)